MDRSVQISSLYKWWPSWHWCFITIIPAKPAKLGTLLLFKRWLGLFSCESFYYSDVSFLPHFEPTAFIDVCLSRYCPMGLIQNTKTFILNVCYVFLFCVFVLFLVFVFVRALLSWCPEAWHIYNFCNIFTLNISWIYICVAAFELHVILPTNDSCIYNLNGQLHVTFQSCYRIRDHHGKAKCIPNKQYNRFSSLVWLFI